MHEFGLGLVDSDSTVFASRRYELRTTVHSTVYGTYRYDGVQNVPRTVQRLPLTVRNVEGCID
jgi:hypothetical protein